MKFPSEKTVDKAIEATMKFANEILIPIFAREIGWDDKDDLKADVCASLLTTVQGITCGAKELEYKKPEKETDEEPEEKSSYCGCKKKKDESDIEFERRVCKEASTRFIKTFERSGMTPTRAKRAIFVAVCSFIDALDLEEEVMEMLKETMG